MAYWTAQVPAAGRFSVAERFYQSSESAHDRVAALYLELLGRFPDQAGADYWAGRIVQDGDLA